MRHTRCICTIRFFPRHRWARLSRCCCCLDRCCRSGTKRSQRSCAPRCSRTHARRTICTTIKCRAYNAKTCQNSIAFQHLSFLLLILTIPAHNMCHFHNTRPIDFHISSYTMHHRMCIVALSHSTWRIRHHNLRM